MGKIPSIPDDRERTIIDDFLGNQAKDEAPEAKSILISVAKKEK
jgi:hypothetical protein